MDEITPSPNLRLCDRATITLRGRSTIMTLHDALRYCDFAACQLLTEPQSLWRITHLPTGGLVGAFFPTMDAAVDAMVRIARLRNDWSALDMTVDLTVTFAQISEICAHHGGRSSVASVSEPDPLPIDQNGYGKTEDVQRIARRPRSVR